MSEHLPLPRPAMLMIYLPDTDTFELAEATVSEVAKHHEHGRGVNGKEIVVHHYVTLSFDYPVGFSWVNAKPNKRDRGVFERLFARLLPKGARRFPHEF